MDDQQPNLLIYLYNLENGELLSTRKRKDYTKETKPIQAIYFTDSKMTEVITFIEYRPVNIEGVKLGYYVDNIGHLFNSKGELITPIYINSGYYVYKLPKIDQSNGKYKQILAHRLFMMAFNPINNMDQMTINHIDNNSANNELSNLEWLSQKENNDKKNKSLINYGIDNYQAKFNYAQIKEILKCLNKGMTYKDILRHIGLDDSGRNEDYIGNIKRGITYKQEVADILKEGFND